jgi:hypothetical protein
MTKEIYLKILSANDVGSTGAHQAGILIPKTNRELLAFLPCLDPTIKNPDTWLNCIDEEGNERKFRFVYYNNKLHEENGTRNEFRITHMTNYFRSIGAKQGDTFEISKQSNTNQFLIRVIKQISKNLDADSPMRIKIKSAWRRVH